MKSKRKRKSDKLKIYVKFKDYEKDLYDWVVEKSRVNRGNKNQTVIKILAEVKERDENDIPSKGIL